MARPNKQQAGFTLTELMITVVVIGILAAVAVPSYTRYIRSVKMQEARTTLPQIALKEKAYFLEFRSYLTVGRNPGGGSPPCGGVQGLWDRNNAQWNALGFRPATPGVYFQYFVTAGQGAGSIPSCQNAIIPNLHYPTTNRAEWFVACAYGNLIGNACASANEANPASLAFGMSGSETFGGRVFGNKNTK